MTIMKFENKKEIATNTKLKDDVSSIGEEERGHSAFDVDRTNAGSSFYAYYNVVCCVCGTGMLGLSTSLGKGGWGALALLLLSWWMAIYSSIILIKCLYRPRKQTSRLPSYKDVAEDAFGPVGGWVAFFFQAWILVGTPILYLVLCAANLNDLCAGSPGEIGIVPWTIIFCVVVAIPMIFLKTMKDIAWTSFVGVVAVLVTTFICVIVAGINDKQNNVSRMVRHDNIIWEGFPVALSTIAFSFGGNVVYPNVEASMKRPKDWNKVIIGGLTTCAILYILIAVPGYYVYGADVKNPLYNSLPNGVPRIICVVFVTLNVLVSAPIYLMSFVLDCEDILKVDRLQPGTKAFIARATFRTSIMAFCSVVGCVVPYFDLLLDLFGAFGYCTTIFIIPIACYWRLTGVRNKPIWELAWNMLILVFGIVGLVFGTWGALEALIDAFQNK